MCMTPSTSNFSMFISSVTHDPHNVSVHVQQNACACVHVCMCMRAYVCVPVQGLNELSCFDTTTDPILAGRMTVLIEWLPEYSNEVILPHQMMKNSCYKLVLVQTALRNFICCLIFLLASSAGTIV